LIATTVAPLNQVCNPNPCQNGGICNAQDWNVYTCICPTNFFGIRCEFFITNPPTTNPCNPNPCQNGGNCVILTTMNNNTPQRTCVCPSNFIGANCEFPTFATTIAPARSCNPNPCLLGGTCIENQFAQNGFVCNCPPGITGTVCSLILTNPF